MLVLSHESALAVTRIVPLARMLSAHAQAGFLATRLSAASVPGEREAREVAGKLGIPLPLHVAVADRADRAPRRSVAVHALGDDIDASSVIHLSDDLYVVCPELCVVQLARGADWENIVLLASELASDYALDPAARGGVSKRPKLMTRLTLERFCASHAGYYGAAAVERVLPLIVEGARSPKESELHLALSSSSRRGGWGIPDVGVNVRIELLPEAAHLARRACLYADLMVRQFDVEYDGNDFHLTREATESDKRRANALHMMGYELYMLTAGQVHDWDSFQIIARALQAQSGIRMRPPSRATEERRRRLWERLFFATRRAGRMVLDGSSTPQTRYRSLVAY